jgi:hypothetical protein
VTVAESKENKELDTTKTPVVLCPVYLCHWRLPETSRNWLLRLRTERCLHAHSIAFINPTQRLVRGLFVGCCLRRVVLSGFFVFLIIIISGRLGARRSRRL